MHQKITETKVAALYDTYDYLAFWEGRDYENRSDFIAISRLIKNLHYSHKNIIEIGAGAGRIASLYQDKWDTIFLLDPSTVQLEIARRRIKNANRVTFLEGSAESIPLPDNSCDTAICTRVFHYIDEPNRAIAEIARILKINGYLILEIPNKVHFKTRVAAWLSAKKRAELHSKNHISRLTKEEHITFLNHHPMKIISELQSNGFVIEEILSVSNFRHRIFKKIVPLIALLSIEWILQRPLAKVWFGPSIYFLARKTV